MKIIKVLTVALSVALSTSALAISTDYKKISEIKIDGDDGYYYFTSTGGWGASGCENAIYAYFIPEQVEDKHAILSVALAAKMSGAQVLFTGGCDNSQYFQATEIWVR